MTLRRSKRFICQKEIRKRQILTVRLALGSRRFRDSLVMHRSPKSNTNARRAPPCPELDYRRSPAVTHSALISREDWNGRISQADSTGSIPVIRLWWIGRLGGSPAKGGSETGGEGTGGRTVWLTMIWVELCDDQARESRMPDQYCEGGHRGSKGQSAVVLRHVGDRKIKEIDHVDVEVNQEPVGTCGDHADSFPSGRARMARYVGCAELSAWQGTERPVFDRGVRSLRGPMGCR